MTPHPPLTDAEKLARYDHIEKRCVALARKLRDLRKDAVNYKKQQDFLTWRKLKAIRVMHRQILELLSPFNDKYFLIARDIVDLITGANI